MALSENAKYQRELRARKRSKVANHVIYALCDPDTLEIRYIGRTYKPSRRLQGHIRDSRNYPEIHKVKTEWIRSLLAKGKKPVMKILCRVLEEDIRYMERYWINHCRKMGFNLTNHGSYKSWYE